MWRVATSKEMKYIVLCKYIVGKKCYQINLITLYTDLVHYKSTRDLTFIFI